jgi:hygromycin-B 7''-O-kinase
LSGLPMNIPSLNDFDRTFKDPVWLDIADYVLRRHRIVFRNLKRAEHGENIVVLVDDAFVLKIYTPKKNGFNRERVALEFAQGKTSLPIPQIAAEGEIEGFYYLVTDRLPGRLMLRPEWLTLEGSAQIGLITQLAYGLKDLHSHDAAEIHFDWREFVEIQVESVVERQRTAGGNPEWLESLPKYLDTYLPLLPERPPSVFMHGDVHFGNLQVTEDRVRPVISGLYDFADSLKGFHEYEFVAIGVLMIQGQGELQREFFRAYGYLDSEINHELRRRLMLLTILYEHSSLMRYAERLGPGSENLTLEALESAIWNFI